MSSIDSPAVARRRVRLALRSARQAKQLTQTQIANAMEWSLSKVMRIEKGEVNVSPGDLKVLLDFLDISDSEQVQQLLNDARVSRQERWTIDAADREYLTPAMIELLQFEAEATTVRYYNNLIIPGIVQTYAYSEALFRRFTSTLDAATVSARIAVRQRRLQEVLYRPHAPSCLVVLDESVLLRPVGGPAVMAEQLDHVLRVIAETRLQVRILPFVSAADSLEFYGAFVLSDLDDVQSALLYRETGTDDEVVHAAEEIGRHRLVFDQMWSRALGDDASADRIAAAVAGLRAGSG
jgi:transcriptional regulator with XRE-family HTH domain